MIDTICGESDAFHPGRLYLSLFFRIVRTVKHRFFADNQLTVFHKFLSPFTEVADHFCTHACQQLFIFLVVHSIMQFFRIFGKVKQLLFTCIEVPDIFNLSVGSRHTNSCHHCSKWHVPDQCICAIPFLCL